MVRIDSHRTIRVLLSFLAALTLFFAAGAQVAQGASTVTKKLSVTLRAQEKANWCWAAAVQMAVEYVTGVKPSQCQIVKWGKVSGSCSGYTKDSFTGDLSVFWNDPSPKGVGAKKSGSYAYLKGGVSSWTAYRTFYNLRKA